MMIKIGLDIHGVIDNRPNYFAWLSRNFRTLGHEIHIITGSFDTPEIRQQLADFGVEFDYFFGMSDWCKNNIDTHVINDLGRLYVDDNVWDKVKAKYCADTGIHVHIDDSERYRESFVNIPTKFVLYNGDEFGAGFGTYNDICSTVQEYNNVIESE